MKLFLTSAFWKNRRRSFLHSFFGSFLLITGNLRRVYTQNGPFCKMATIMITWTNAARFSFPFVTAFVVHTGKTRATAVHTSITRTQTLPSSAGGISGGRSSYCVLAFTQNNREERRLHTRVVASAVKTCRRPYDGSQADGRGDYIEGRWLKVSTEDNSSESFARTQANNHTRWDQMGPCCCPSLSTCGCLTEIATNSHGQSFTLEASFSNSGARSKGWTTTSVKN